MRIPKLTVRVACAALLASCGCTGVIHDHNDSDGDGDEEVPDAGAARERVRRLSVVELANSIEALTGLRPDAIGRIPPDSRDLTFDRVATTQTVSAVHLDAFQAVADEVAYRLIAERRLDDIAPACADELMPPPAPRRRQRIAAIGLVAEPLWALCTRDSDNESCGATLADDALYFLYAPTPSVSTQYQIPADGDYRISLRVQIETSPAAELRVDDQPIETWTLDSEEEMELSATVPLTRGAHAVRFGFDFAQTGESKLHILDLTVDGPIDAGAGELAGARRDCAVAVIDRLTPRAFRRPVDAETRARYLALYDEGAGEGSFHDGLRMVMEAILISPRFAYLVELGTPVPGRPGHYALDDFEIASRLSYALCERPPDDELFAAAEAGALHTPEQIDAHARRLLDSPCGRATVARFYDQWLWLDRLPDVARDPALYPGFTSALPAAMWRETRTFIERAVFDGGAALPELFSAGYSWLDSEVAPLYGLEVAGEQPVMTELPEHRAGLLTQPSVLTVTSKFSQTSPVLRGVFVIEQVLCGSLPSPPQDVDITPPALDPDATTRERWQRHSSDPSCAACHTLIDPVGFAFESFDAVGRYRTEENGRPVDDTGGLPSIGIDDGELRGAAELARAVAGSPELARCFARQWFRFAAAREEDAALDGATLDEIAEAAVSRPGGVEQALLAVTRSYAFRHRITPEEE